MPKKLKKNNVAYYVSIVLLLLFIGCSIQKNHKLLTTFFDGVDDVEIAYASVSRDSLMRSASNKRNDYLQKIRPDKFTHKPWKEKKCTSCHDGPGHVIAAVPDLCFNCHKNFNEGIKYTHGPVAAGACLKCHNQHFADYPRLTIRPGQQLCTYCHNSSLVFSKKYHKNIEDAACTECHNPHGGNNRSFLWDGIARGPRGATALGDLSGRRLSGQIYSKAPGDVKTPITVDILNSRDEVVATVLTDSTGKYSLDNVHPDENYTFKFESDIPELNIQLLDSKNDVVGRVRRGARGAYIFDKETYAAAHSKMEPLPGRMSATVPGTVNAVVASPQAAAQPNKEKEVAKVVEPEAKAAITAIEEKHEANLELPAVAPVDVDHSNPIDTASAESKEIPAPNTVSTERKENPADKQPGLVLNAATVEKEQQIKTDNNGGVHVPTKEAGVLGEPYESTASGDFVNIKLGGRTFRFRKGTVVEVLGNDGMVMAVAKVDSNGNFQLCKEYGGAVAVPQDSSLYSKIVFMNYRVDGGIGAGSTGVANPLVAPGLQQFGTNSASSSQDPAEVARKAAAIAQSAAEIAQQAANLALRAANKAAGKTSAKLPDDEGDSKIDKLRQGNVLKGASLLRVIYYEFGSAELTDVALDELDKVIMYMDNNPEVGLELFAYTDSKGSIDKNKRLARRRATVVKEYLVSQGVDSSMIKIQEVSDDNLGKDAEETSEERKKRRKVEIYINND